MRRLLFPYREPLAMRQTQEEIRLPLAIVPLCILEDVLSAEQQLEGLQEEAEIASCGSQEAGEVPEPSQGVCHCTNSMPSLRTKELFPCFLLIAAVSFCGSLGFSKQGGSSFNTHLGFLLACLLPTKL